MNFEKIPPVDSSKQLLEIAFRRARERGSLKKNEESRDYLERVRRKEMQKLDVVKDILTSKLEKILFSFPQLEELPDFYFHLIKITLEYSLLKKSLGAILWAMKRIRELHRDQVRKMAHENSAEKMHRLSREYYGRIASIMKQIDVNLKFLEESRRIMKTYPDIKEMFTVCIYGFPNVGKTTLLNALTGTKAEIAAYAFTTKTINAGYLRQQGMEIQMLDVPGTLAREEKMNLIERQAELVREELADVIIFVFDLSGYSGYSIEKQEQLFQKIDRKKKVLVYLSKRDLTPPELLEEFKYPYFSVDKLKEHIVAAAKEQR